LKRFEFGIRWSQISVLLPSKTAFEIVNSQIDTDNDNSSNTIQLNMNKFP